MASAGKEQAKLLQEYNYLTALIKQHKEPQPSREVKDGTKQMHKVHSQHGGHQVTKTLWSRSHDTREKKKTEVSGVVSHHVKKSFSVPTLPGNPTRNRNLLHRKHDSTLRRSSGENKCKREQPAKPRVKVEPAESRVKLEHDSSFVKLEPTDNARVVLKRDHSAEHGIKREQDVQETAVRQRTYQKNSRTVISKYSGGDFVNIDERKLLFDKKSIKVRIKNEFSEPVKKTRTVLAPTKHLGMVPSHFVKSEGPSSFGSAVTVTNDPPSSQARKSLSKYKWFGAKQSETASPPSGMFKLSTSSVINSSSSGQNVLTQKLPQRTLTAPVEQKKIDSILPKPLMTSTPDDVLLSWEHAPRIPLRRLSSERQKPTPKQTYAKVICSKYKLHKISNPSVPLPSARRMQQRKSLTLVKSPTKLVKKHIPISDLSTPRPLLKRNTKYKYQVACKHDESHAETKRPAETPRSHKMHLGKQKSSRYRYVRRLSNSSSKSQRNWKSTYSLKRDNDTAMLMYLTNLLGRPVKNVSNNKYKFVSAASNPKRKTSQEYSQKRLPSKSKLKLDRRVPAASTQSTERYVVLNGFVYRSSARKLEKTPSSGATSANRTQKTVVIRKMNHANMKTVTVNGVKFRMDQSGKTLHRIDSNTTAKTNVTSTSTSSPASRRPITRLDIGGLTYYQSRPGTLVRATNLRNRIVANQVVHRTKSWAVASKQRQMKRQYCLYYQRFGRCNRGKKCPSIHDPEKVAVCKRFLRGTCKITDCPFSHNLSKEKMPVCSYFLRGVCTRENCPYLHVKVNQDADVCNGFLAGYCPLGDKCKKKHTLVCQSFLKTGQCSVGKSCKLVHPNIRKRPRSSSTYQKPAKRRALATEVAQSGKSATETPESQPTRVHPSASKNLEAMPSFIALEPDKEEVAIPVRQEAKPERPVLQIRPNFT